MLSPKIALCDKQFHLTVDAIDFVGHPTLLNADRPGIGMRFARLVQRMNMGRVSGTAAQPSDVQGSPYRQAHQNALTMFNLVFALSSSQEELAFMYEHLVKVTAALKYEQLRRGYIRKETELILSIKEKCAAQGIRCIAPCTRSRGRRRRQSRHHRRDPRA